jgi:hypothetical protein
MTPEAEIQGTVRMNRWFPSLLIVWNIFDVVVHVAVDLVEPWRVAGNIVAIVAVVVVLAGAARAVASQLLVGAAGLVVVVNAIDSALDGWIAPSFIFIGVSLALLLLWAQEIARKSASPADTGTGPVYLRWWMAIVATVGGLVLIALVGEQEDFEIGPLAALHDGELVAADYWADEPASLSAGMGFDNITACLK